MAQSSTTTGVSDQQSTFLDHGADSPVARRRDPSRLLPERPLRRSRRPGGVGPPTDGRHPPRSRWRRPTRCRAERVPPAPTTPPVPQAHPGPGGPHHDKKSEHQERRAPVPTTGVIRGTRLRHTQNQSLEQAEQHRQDKDHHENRRNRRYDNRANVEPEGPVRPGR
jgi:hypothetical protein